MSLVARWHDAPTPSRARVLAFSVVVVATSGMMYELTLATLASYVLGSAVTQFSITLGVYLSAMGVGTLASRSLRAPLVARFVEVETAVALVGGSSAGLLFIAFSRTAWFRSILYGEVSLIGLLVGVELPLLLGLLREDVGFDESVSLGMAYDYVGGLLAALVFPLVLMPLLGLVRTAALAGMVNAGVACIGAHLLGLGATRRVLSWIPAAALVALAFLFAYGDVVARLTED